MKRPGISVIIPAHGAAKYICECIGSIINQRTWLDIEILIGVDNCDSTKKELSKSKSFFPKDEGKKIRVFETKESNNVGPYLIRNSLVKKATKPLVLFFDADDIMMLDMVTSVYSLVRKGCFVRFPYINFKDGDGPSSGNFVPTVAEGVFCCGVDLFNKIGGFQPWLCGADSEFIKRSGKNKIRTLEIKYPLFYRRLHRNSLTNSPETGRNSKIRSRYRRYIEKNHDWSIPIDTKCVDMVEL
jgi:glycosyltransferase involved in cell wall biosynthesis